MSSRFYRANVLEKLALLDRDEELKLLAFLASLAGLPRDSCLGEQLPDRLLHYSQSVLLCNPRKLNHERG